MHSILLFGATGHLGRHIADEAHRRGHAVTAVVREASRGRAAHDQVVAEVTDARTLRGICAGRSVVISALGKSVSLNDRGRPSFTEVDLEANTHILREAKEAGVKKFVYVSAMHADRHPELTYFRVHEEFSRRLQASGLGFTIIRPPALFSAFIDLIDLARKGRLMDIGAGDKRTNPIFEGDLATVCVDAVDAPDGIIEAGGPEVFTRKELNAIVQRVAAPDKKVKQLPSALMRLGLPLVRPIDRNLYDKLAFYAAVLNEDLIAPRIGTARFEDYVRQKATK